MERLFRAQLQQRPMGFYLGLRLDKAEQLLRYSRMSVRDVGIACGFSSPARFSRAFRARHGRPPRAMRKG
jgi:AraC family carnitine catabolism transcriptional activator